MTQPRHAVVETPLGWVALLGTERGLRHLTLPKPTPHEALSQLLLEEGELGEECPSCFTPVIELLQAFYRGEPVDFSSVVLDMEGRPPFYRRVWEALREIPRGTTITYGELAARVGRPRAARAVGQAMAANPYPPIVPCHRVIAHNGGLGSFGGGLDLKARLLALEGLTR